MHSQFPRYTLLLCLFLFLFHIIGCNRVLWNTQEVKDLFNIYPEFIPNLWGQSVATTANVYVCAGLPFFGGTSVFAGTNNYVAIGYGTALPHTVVYYTLTFSLVGTWAATDGFYLHITDEYNNVQTVSWQPGGPLNTPLCVFNDIKLKGKLTHTGAALGFYVQKFPNPTSTFGFRKLSIRLANAAAPTAQEKLCLSSKTFTSIGAAVASQCPCTSGKYFTGTGCADCDDACEECFGAGPANCYTCNFGYYHNGIQCVRCTSTCTDCATCGICSEYDYYMDHVCVPTCPLPFLAVVSDDRRYCLSPCKDTEVLYTDGTCHPTCIYPFTLVAVHNKQVCSSPCPGQTLFYNQGCSSAPCPYPLVNELISGGSMYVCQYPCSNYPAEIYYQNNATCLPACNFPYVTRTYGAFTACEPPCPGGGVSRYWDGTGTCSTCPPLLQPKLVSGVWTCDPPMCGKVFCSECGPGNTCGAYYHCNTTLGAFCMPYYTYKLEAKLIRPILNGVTLSVEVVPIAGIRDSEDILNYRIYGLQLGVDYTVTVDKKSKGNYEVQIVILQNVNQTTPMASFEYASATLGLQLDYKLPRLTFINEGIQTSAQDTNKGSQIAFLIFVVTIVGSVFSGGLSSVWTAMPESQYSYYLLYLNVNYLHHTQVYFESLSNYDILVGGGDDSEEHIDLTYRNVLPRKFFIRDYTPDFLGNSDQLFLQGLISISVLLISTLILKYVRFSGRGILIMKGVGFIRKSLKWNLLIRQILTYSLPLFTASFIQIYSIIFGYKIYLPSILLALVTLLAFILCFKYMLSLISNIPKGKHEINAYSQNYGTLWEDLDVSLISKYYYWLVALRGCLLAYMAVFFAVFPYVQIIVLMVYQCFIVSLFFGKFRLRPVFSDKSLNKVTLIEEFCLLVVKVMIFVFVIIEFKVGDKTLILMGWLIVLPAVIAQGVQIIHSVSSQFDIGKLERIYEMIKTKVSSKKQKKIRRVRRMIKNVKIIEIHKQ